MKRLAATLPVILAAAIMVTAIPARADDVNTMPMGGIQGMQEQKNECLLVAMNCGNQVDSIQQRIDRLRTEIGKGTDVYTPEELRTLKDQLDDANRSFEYLESNGGA